jgi:tetratricopeptide (TPR) repeat protein
MTLLIFIFLFNSHFPNEEKLIAPLEILTVESELENKEIAILKKEIAKAETLITNKPDSAFIILTSAYTKSLYYLNTKFKNDESKREKIEEQISKIVYGIATIYFNKGEIDKATKLYFNVLKMFEKYDNKTGIGSTLNNIGLIYQYYLNDNEKAHLNYQKAYTILEEAKDSFNLSGALHNIANISKIMGNNEEAIKFYNKSIEISRSNADENSEAKALFNLATIYFEQGNKKLALEYLLDCERIFSKPRGDKNWLSHTYSSLGAFFNKTGDYNKAEHYALLAYEIAIEIDFLELIKRSSNILQKIYKNKKEWDKAFKFYNKYISMRDSMNREEQRNVIVKQQLKYDYEKKIMADSLKFYSSQLEQDLIIKQQDNKFQSARKIRNIVILAAILLIISSWLLYNRYEIKVKQKQVELKIEALELEQKLLRVQMNPHFIFKTLKSIQNFIEENKPALARKFLVKFSMLVRYILEQSKKSEISLNEEILTLKLYLEMEQLRFQHKFNFKINDAMITSQYEIKIPPLLIQPFVENIIVNSIMKHQGQSELNITLTFDDNLLICNVEDNTNQQNSVEEQMEAEELSQSAMSLKLAKERLQNFSKNNVYGSFAILNTDQQTKLTKLSIPA